MENVKQGFAAIGLQSKTHVVMACVNKANSELSSHQKKIFKVDDHIGVAIAGLTADGRVLSRYMRSECINYNYTYESPLPVGRLVVQLADKAQVWSLVRRFDQPQKYKPFVSRCVVQGNLEIGSLREVDVKSGLPATTCTERLELLDDDEHLLSIRIIGGDHRLRNYSSIISLHPEIVDGRPETVVIESFVVDVPEGNTKDETCYFLEALIQCNLKSLCDVSERLAVQDHTEPIDRSEIEAETCNGEGAAMDEASELSYISEVLETDRQ